MTKEEEVLEWRAGRAERRLEHAIRALRARGEDTVQEVRALARPARSIALGAIVGSLLALVTLFFATRRLARARMR